MKYRVPSYFDTFRCIGGACQDTCCAGWYIAIDEATYKKYKKVKDPVMKKRLDKELVAKKGPVSSEHVAKIKLKNNRCAFLSSEGLCDLYTHLGEQYLSQTCQLYPRTFNQVNDTLECSLALSCPEAARRILLNPEGITFKEEERAEKQVVISARLAVNPQKPKGYQDYLLEIRQFLIERLQKREDPFQLRFLKLEAYMRELDHLVRIGALKKIPSFIQERTFNERQNKTIVSEASYDERAYIILLDALKSMRNGKKWPSPSYEAFYEEMLQGLDKEGGFNKQQFEKGCQIYEETFLNSYSYILENYFVNYIYERAVPLDGETLLQSLAYLKFYKQLIELHLIGLVLHHESLTKEKVVNFLQAFTKVFDHNELYRKQLIKAIENK